MSGTTQDLDLLVFLLRRWKTILLFGALGFAIAAVVAFRATSWYAARLTVVPSQPSRESAAMALASKLPGLDASSADSKRIEAVLRSQSVADEVIAKFKLQQRYGATHIEDVRVALSKHCVTDVDKKSGVVALTCEDTDPATARDMTEYFGEVGNRVFGRISTGSAHEEARFLETQVTQARKDVDEASRALRDFQEQHKVIDLPEQTKAVISAMASMKGELISKQLELSYVSGFAGNRESSVVQLQQQIAVLQSKLDQLEADHKAASAPAGAGSGSGSFFPNAMNVPGLRFELEQLMRDQKIKETVFGLLTQRYEMAKVDAARDTPSFQILDHPTVPTLRSRPARKKLAMAGGAAGGLLGIAFVVIPVWWRRRMTGVATP